MSLDWGWLVLVLGLGLASYRITRFLVVDSLFGMSPDSGSRFSVHVDHFAYSADGSDRNWLRGKIGDLLTCTWCLGFWISTGALAAWTWSVPWQAASPQQWVLTAFAVAGVQGYLNSRMNA